MFAKTFYCLLISFVSGHFSNHTIQQLKNKQDINLDISRSPVVDINTSNPSSKNCVFRMEDREITLIIQLTKSDFVNIVDLHLFFDDGYNNQPFGDYQISLVNPVGREIERTLDTGFRGFVTWTLNAGRKSFELRIYESPKDCIKRLNIHDVASKTYERIVSKMKQPTYKICYTFPMHSPRDTRRCKPEAFTKLDWDGALLLVTYAMFILFPIYFSWLLFSLYSRTLFDVKYHKYLKLEESPMSPTSIFLKIFWEENPEGNCCAISFIRRFVTMSFLTYIVWFHIPKPVVFIFRYTRYLVLYSTASIPFSRMFLRPMIFSILEKKANKQNTSSFLGGFGDCVNCLTLPFNLKFWKEMFRCFEFDSERRQPFRKSLKKIGIFCVFFPLLLILQSLNFCFQTFTILKLLLELGYTDKNARPSRKKEVLISLNNGLMTFSLLVLLFHILFVLVFAIQSFSLGIFLNLNYFTPYLAFASVLTFYCHSYWKSLEEKYLVLKRVIYDVCRERQEEIKTPGQNEVALPVCQEREEEIHGRNKVALPVCQEREEEIHGRNEVALPVCQEREEEILGRNEVALPVVSKEVYEIIREKFLPYHTNISSLILNLLWYFAFSSAILVLVNMLHAFHFIAAIQVFTTASLGIIPYVFNMVALKTSEEKQKAWNEKLKLNVKTLVEGLTPTENHDRPTTVLKVQHTDKSDAEKNKLLNRCASLRQLVLNMTFPCRE